MDKETEYKLTYVLELLERIKRELELDDDYDENLNTALKVLRSIPFVRRCDHDNE